MAFRILEEILKAIFQLEKIPCRNSLSVDYNRVCWHYYQIRIMLLPKRKMGFVETKRAGAEPGPIQKKNKRNQKLRY